MMEVGDTTWEYYSILEECVSTGNRLIINEPPQSPLFPLLLILPKGELKIACLKREREYGISLLSDITISIVKDVHRYVEEVLKNAVKCERRILLLLSYRDAKAKNSSSAIKIILSPYFSSMSFDNAF